MELIVGSLRLSLSRKPSRANRNRFKNSVSNSETPVCWNLPEKKRANSSPHEETMGPHRSPLNVGIRGQRLPLLYVAQPDMHPLSTQLASPHVAPRILRRFSARRSVHRSRPPLHTTAPRTGGARPPPLWCRPGGAGDRRPASPRPVGTPEIRLGRLRSPISQGIPVTAEERRARPM